MPLELPRLAAERGIAVVFTLHDFWTICQRTFLVDAGWRPCGGPSALGCWRCVSRVPDFVPRAGPFERLTGLNARALVATAPGPFHRRRRRVADMLAHVDLFVSPTRHLRDRLLRYVNLPEADIVVRPFGLAPLPPRTTGTPAVEGRLRIGFVGSVNFHKGAHVLLDAFAGGLDAELVVFGRMSPAFEAARGNELRARATFHGVVDSARRREIYDAMDVLVLPSVCHENFPLVIAEAFMAGVPVVASNLAGMAEAVRHDVDGLLVPPGDAGALRGALQALVDERSLVERLRQAAPPVKSLTAHAHEMAEILDEARARARRRARGRR
jgi:glycosyltransferase involved in cell wall biosynthesis